MNFVLIASVAICCLSAVFAGPYGDPVQLSVPSRNPFLNNYCDIAVTFVDYIRDLPASLRFFGCIGTGFIDKVCSTTFSHEFCMETSNSVEDENGQNDLDGFENNDDNEVDDETKVSSSSIDIKDPTSAITTTPTPGDTEAHTNPVDHSSPAEKSELGTKSKTSKKSNSSNKKSKNAKGTSKVSQHAKSKSKQAQNKNAHGKSKDNSKTKSKGHNDKKNTN